MKLYHYTSAEHFAAIQRDRVLLPSESNVGSPIQGMQPFGRQYGPNVVWLLDTPDLGGHPHGLAGSVFDKTAVRISVELKYAIKWYEWSWTSKMNLKWFNAFVKTGGGPEAANRWFVYPAPIAQRDWIAVETIHP